MHCCLWCFFHDRLALLLNCSGCTLVVPLALLLDHTL
jgi:hypothetical protein